MALRPASQDEKKNAAQTQGPERLDGAHQRLGPKLKPYPLSCGIEELT